MLKPRWFSLRPQGVLLSQWMCPACQSRLQWPYRQASSTSQTPKASTTRPQTSVPKAVPSDKELRSSGFKLEPLSQALGQSKPPISGENSVVDHRTWRERRDDFFNHDKHLERRKELTRKVLKPYFRDWTNMNYHKGKTFLAPPRIFKAEAARYFPNMQGYTLESPSKTSDTTNVFTGKTSIVSVYSSKWAEDMTQTFVGEEKNYQLGREMERLKKFGLQRVWIHFEEDWFKAKLIRWYVRTMKKNFRQRDWRRYFVVTKGFTDDMKVTIGMANAKVGYVYVVDSDCKIRWAGNGDAVEAEREGLVGAVRKLVERARLAGEGARMGKVLKDMGGSKENEKSGSVIL